MNTSIGAARATFDPDRDGPEPVQTLPGTFGDGDTRWKMYQTLLDMTYARQVSEKVSLGITGCWRHRSSGWKACNLGAFDTDIAISGRRGDA